MLGYASGSGGGLSCSCWRAVSSDSSESEEELGPRGGNLGKLVRAGGWGRKPRMGNLVSLCLNDRWRWPSWQSNWLNILNNKETYNPKSHCALRTERYLLF